MVLFIVIFVACEPAASVSNYSYRAELPSSFPQPTSSMKDNSTAPANPAISSQTGLGCLLSSYGDMSSSEEEGEIKDPPKPVNTSVSGRYSANIDVSLSALLLLYCFAA